MLNNPIRFNDPSGHVCSDPDDPSPSCDGGGGSPPNTSTPLQSAPVVITNPDPLDDGLRQKRQGSNKSSSDDDADNDCNWSNVAVCVDNWLWDNVPSAFGFHVGASGQISAGIEPGVVPFEFLLLYNWRSGQVSLFYTGEGFIYLGSPSWLGGNVYGGWTSVKGLSNNQYYEGPALYVGGTAAADVFGKLGVSKVYGWAQDPESLGGIPTKVFIDPVSLRPITYQQTAITVGGNLGFNGVDAGVMGGFAYTIQILPK